MTPSHLHQNNSAASLCWQLLVILSLIVFALPLFAQDATPSSSQPASMSTSKSVSLDTAPALPFRMDSIGVWSGYSPTSMENIGKMPDRKFFTLNAEARWVLYRGDRTTLRWTAALVPIAVISQPAEIYQTNGATQQIAPGRVLYGAGATPLGMRLNFRNSHKVQPFIASDAGFIYFNKQVPVVYSSQYNFTFSFGGGIEIFNGRHGSLDLGYRYHHISNANTATRNPGVDSGLLWAGYSWGRR